MVISVRAPFLLCELYMKINALFAALLTILCCANSFAAARRCADVVKVDPATSESESNPKNSPIEVSISEAGFDYIYDIQDRYLKLIKKAGMEKLLPPKEVKALLQDLEMQKYPIILGQIMDLIEKDTTQKETKEKFFSALRTVLNNKVPASTIEPRIKALIASAPESLKRVLGDMTLEETQELLYGKDLKKPSSESLIGQYLKKTGAKTTLRRFPVTQNSKRLGPTRLVVTVSERSMPEFLKILGTTELLGTLNHATFIHEGKLKGFNNNGGNQDLRFPGVSKIMPLIILKSTEAQRFSQFYTMYEKYLYWKPENPGHNPWVLNGYCSVGTYTCCTHWMGNVPMGDKLVTRYAFPGAGNGKKLAPYQHQDPLVHRVWKVPGNMQLSEVLGQVEAQKKGEFANTGWIFVTLLGPTTVERVPVAIMYVQDHTQPLPEKFEYLHENPI